MTDEGAEVGAAWESGVEVAGRISVGLLTWLEFKQKKFINIVLSVIARVNNVPFK